MRYTGTLQELQMIILRKHRTKTISIRVSNSSSREGNVKGLCRASLYVHRIEYLGSKRHSNPGTFRSDGGTSNRRPCSLVCLEIIVRVGLGVDPHVYFSPILLHHIERMNINVTVFCLEIEHGTVTTISTCQSSLQSRL